MNAVVADKGLFKAAPAGKPDLLCVIQITFSDLNLSYVPSIKTPCTPCWRNSEEQDNDPL